MVDFIPDQNPLNNEPVVEQLILLPATDDRDLARWGGACDSYAQAFPNVSVSNNTGALLRSHWQAIFIIQPDFWPRSIWQAIAPANRPGLHLERLEAPTPEILRQILHLRVYYNRRFGPAQGIISLPDPGPVTANNIDMYIGLHGRGDGELQRKDIDVMRTARIQAVKLLSTASQTSIAMLHELNPAMFIMVRPFVPFSHNGRPRKISPAEFVDASASDLQRLFDASPSIRHVEVHNEPNLVLEGMGESWQSGAEFAEWYIEVIRLYKEHWPDKLYGFPGLSPGPDLTRLRRDSSAFLHEAWAAVVASSWIGVHAYWRNEREMVDTQHGQGWQTYQRLFADQKIYITEFGNPVQPKPVVGEQYLRYYNTLRNAKGIGGAFAYLSSISDRRESARWAWIDEDNRDAGIAPIIARH